MSVDTGRSAFILAAGYGKRMRPLTETRPKPLIEVNGKALIQYALDALQHSAVKRAVVNAHYLGDQIVAWARSPHDITIDVSDERDALLDTGGGIRKALPMLGDEPFFVLNSDGFWIDRGIPALDRLREAWDDDTMDCLLLICPLEHCRGFDGKGDFHIGGDGRLERRTDPVREVFAYIGAYLVHPRIFASASEGAFSMNVLWNGAIARKRLFGIVHHGLWLHVGTPEAIALAEHELGNL
jgi:N-acetyl-alpha-D-muramate 1-phosphate uridylyltransferase